MDTRTMHVNVGSAATAQQLFRQAAQLIETALVKIDMAEVPCPTCGTRLFRRRTAARIYEQFSDTPTKLRGAVDRLDAADLEITSPVYTAALAIRSTKSVR